jgi:hypothetical protein
MSSGSEGSLWRLRPATLVVPVLSDHPVWVRPTHSGTDKIDSSVETVPLRYVALGLAAAGERRTRDAASASMRAAAVASWPAAQVWRSPLTAPLRDRAARAADGLARDGQELVARSRADARDAGAQAVRRLEEQLSGSNLIDQALDRLLANGAFDRIIAVVVNHPATDALIANVLDAPGMDRLITRVMESRLVDELTAQLLASEEMQMVLEYVTRSPELRAALAHQTAGLADDVAVGVRSRTFAADATAERFARVLLRRRRRPETAS